MIVRKRIRGKETKIVQRSAMPLASHGRVIIQLHVWGGNRSDFDVVVQANELRKVRDACNEALGQVTGYEHTSTVKVK